MDKWEGVIEFVAVAEVASFTEAANRLSTSVAQVSRKVGRLEQRLSSKLLNRTTRKVTLTEVGQTYYQHCRHLVDGLDAAERAVTDLRTSLSGKIKITAPVTYGEQKLTRHLNQFLLQHPDVSLEVVLSNRKLDLLEHGFDLAIRLGSLDDSSAIAKRLSSRQMHVCASPGYLQCYGEPHSLLELNHHQCLQGSNAYWRFMENGQKRQLKVQGRIQCNSGKALVESALQGLGIVQLPNYYLEEHLASGELVELLTQYKDEQEGIWALYPHNRFLTAKVRSLVDYLSEVL